MQRNKCLGTLRTGLLIVAATLTWASGAAAGTYKIIHFFQWPKIPSGNLTFDAAGNLYGTTQSGGGSSLWRQRLRHRVEAGAQSEGDLDGKHNPQLYRRGWSRPP